MIAKDLENCLHVAFVEARQDRHQFLSVEHLLLALLDEPAAAKVLRNCGANMTKLRRELGRLIAELTPLVDENREVDTQPAPGFQRVLQRAILHAQSMAEQEVNGADVLLAIFEEKDSHAVRVLAHQGITRFEAVFSRAHGVAPTAPSYEAEPPDAPELQVVLHNDSFTPMAFVVEVLRAFFLMSDEEAKEAMLEVHRRGAAVCGLYSRESAWQVMKEVMDHARRHGHPLRCEVVVPK